MASPQKEHGFTPIANELLRALIRQDFTGHQWRVLLTVALDSYGRNKKDSTLSINQIASLSDLRRERVRESLRELVGRKIVLPGGRTENRPTHQNVRKINKDYDGWGGRKSVLGTENRPTPHAFSVRARGISGVTSTPTPTANTLNVNNKNEPPQKRRPAATPPDSRIRFLIQDFFKRLETKLGEKPKAFNGGAAGRIFAQLLKDYPPEKIASRVASWFDSSDPFIAKRGWRIEDFGTYFNTLKGGPLAHQNRASGGYIGASPITEKYASLTNRQRHAN